ncbi:putative quinol monooxygenase [Methylobacterium sp. P31]
MAKALHIRMKAKPGKGSEVEQLLRDIYLTVQRNPPSTPWYGYRLNESVFGIFEAAHDAGDREAHLKSDASRMLKERGASILAEPARIELLDLVAFRLGSTMTTPV